MASSGQLKAAALEAPGKRVEPTGEGMAAALEQSLAVLPLVGQAVQEWRPELADAWQKHHRTHFQRRLRVCRMASAILRRPWLSATALQLIRIFYLNYLA